MFPGAHASVYRNEVGEPLGWDRPSDDEPDCDPYADPFGGPDDEDDDEDDACEGHPAGPFDPMGVTTFCDGRCRA